MRPFPVQPAITHHQHHEDPALRADDTGRDAMDSYEVTVFRTEMITFTLRADSAQDAEERYLLDGEETDSETVGLRVDSTKRQDEPTRPV
ncbi:hypothetical protein ACWEKM_27630 [Streptomyces sp. NPDC004752]